MPSGRAQPRRYALPLVSSPASAAITSRENRWLKRFRAALAGEADAPGVVGVEGPHLVEEALRAGVQLLAVLTSSAGEKHAERLGAASNPEEIAAAAGSRPPRSSAPNAGDAGEAGTRSPALLKTTDRLFASVAGTQTPQGIAALVRLPEYGLDDLLSGVPLVVVLVAVQDPGNVGTIVRSAEAFGATGLAATAGTANPLGPKAIRASAGSIFRLPVIARAQPPLLLAQLKMAGVKLVATVSAGAATGVPTASPHQLDLRQPVALLLGSEPHGLPEPILRACDAAVRIPVATPVESLNAAVAAAVVLYEAARQREVPS